MHHPHTPTCAPTRRAGHRRIALIAAAVTSTAVLLAGCATSSNPPPGVPPNSPTLGTAPLACADMAALTVPAAAIGLPTRGARVTLATVVAPGGTGAAALPEYCKVRADRAGHQVGAKESTRSAPIVVFSRWK
ncbi:MAG: hypothetical protein EON54_04685 [Alcaligenaceae bacterium]|nr:MAG: hypothetical protein EON54_04685 [Alcaligenaceae bacterium]